MWVDPAEAAMGEAEGAEKTDEREFLTSFPCWDAVNKQPTVTGDWTQVDFSLSAAELTVENDPASTVIWPHTLFNYKTNMFYFWKLVLFG